ncbi:hypothetical protein H5T57_02300, partial [Candidatus Bipolaricaulota bacterium]|nr:hypothetical protein [Candidatus Bipolaricaulota bacterium]
MKLGERIIDVLLRVGHALRTRVLPALLDLVFLAYFWVATNVTVSYFRFGLLDYSLLPWSWMAIVVVVAAA